MADPRPDHSWPSHSAAAVGCAGPAFLYAGTAHLLSALTPSLITPGRSRKYDDLVLSDFVIDEEPAPGVVLALHRATHATLQVLATRLAELDLPASEINVLANLAGHQPLTVGALAAATATRPTTLTSVLDRLARRGYVMREVDPADRRSFLISLTPDGGRAAAAVSAAVDGLERAALVRVSEAERAGFLAVIRALSEVSSDPEPRPAPAPPAPGPPAPRRAPA